MTAIRPEVETIKGEIVEYRVRNADGWGTGELRLAGGRSALDEVTIVGKIVGAREGDTVELTGIWDEHPKFGRQFKIRSCNASRPDDTEGKVKWLASRLPDVGANRARELCERFGTELWTVIETAHERLAEVPGITHERAVAIRDAYLAHRSERDAMVALRGWGLTDGQVARCVAEWGTLAKAVERIRGNPYELSSCVHGFGFRRADAVASKMGVAPDSPMRIRAGVEHVLDAACSEGHCFMSGRALQRMTAELLRVPEESVPQAIIAAAGSSRIVRHGWRVFPKRLDLAECRCANALTKLLERNTK